MTKTVPRGKIKKYLSPRGEFFVMKRDIDENLRLHIEQCEEAVADPESGAHELAKEVLPGLKFWEEHFMSKIKW